MATSTATPIEVDTRIADLAEELHAAATRRERIVNGMHRLIGETLQGGRRARVWPTTDDEAAEILRAMKSDDSHFAERQEWYLTNIANLDVAIRETTAKIDDLENEHDRRGGWTRFFTVPGGHIHSGARCKSGTIRPTTQIGWNPQLSGTTIEDAVAALGPNLCTHCFPQAPVEWTQGDKPADDGTCPNKTITAEQRSAINWRLAYIYTVCAECGREGVSVTNPRNPMAAKLRKHKRP